MPFADNFRALAARFRARLPQGLAGFCRQTLQLRGEHPSAAARAMAWCGAVTLGFLVLAGGVLFAVSYEEAADAQEDVLEEAAGLLARANVAFSTEPARLEVLYMDDDDFEDRYVLEHAPAPAAGTDILVHTLHKSGRALQYRSAAPLRDGFQTLSIDGRDYRFLVMTLRNGSRIAVAQRTEDVWEAAALGAFKATAPILILTVLLFAILSVLLWRLMAPVRSLADDISSRRGEDLEPLPDAGVPAELLPLVAATNGLFERVDELRRREARFVADAAHELRSPLAALSLQAERLAAEDLTPGARARLETLRAGIDRAVRQVSQLLALKRAQAGAANPAEAALRAEDADPAEALGRAVEDVWTEAEAKSIEIEAEGFDAEEDGGPADPAASRFPMPADDLFTTLRNLLENAVRYTPEGGRITVAFRAADPSKVRPAEIAVSDTGPGIPEAERARVFDPFYRVLGTGVTGTGLGLSIVKTLAEKSGASIEATDADPAAPAGRRGLRMTLRGRPQK